MLVRKQYAMPVHWVLFHKPNTSYNAIKDRLLAEVRKAFKPEFLNHIDDIIVFRPLAKEHLQQIVKA